MLSLAELQTQHAKYEGDIIIKFSEVEREERIVKKSTALIVELGELANEKEEFFKFFKINHRNDKEKQLKEAADCLAYYLGLSNELGMDLNEPNMELIENCSKEPNKHFKDATREITYIDYGQGQQYRRICILKSFGHYLKLLLSLKIDFEDVKKTYLEFVLGDNIRRQKENY